MDLDVLYRVLVDSMWLFLGGWVVAILAASFVVFRNDASAAGTRATWITGRGLKSSSASPARH
jgi:hypothetical protein